MNGANPLKAAWSILRNQLKVEPPRPSGDARVDHLALVEPLEMLARSGVAVLRDARPDLDRYICALSVVDPNQLSRPEALAYWLNLYNAGALLLAADAFATGEESVLRIPGAFDTPFVEISGEPLSLDAIEHAKIRRFGDPRIHAAIVCGSVSCPRLRGEPYVGERIDQQLDNQLRRFLAAGGAVVRDGRLHLSRVFLWYGSDFVRPQKMPTWLPASRRRVANALRRWLDEDTSKFLDRAAPGIHFQPYDWGLRCTVG